MTVDAVLFDMDGTLVDSDAVVERVWRAWAREHDVDEDLVLTTMPGRPAADTVRLVRPDLDADAEGRRQLEKEYVDLDGVVATPGALALTAELDRRGTPWAVVTSADARLAALRLGAAGITPPLLVTRDQLTHGKPHPEGYLHAAEQLGVDPTRCLVVEDTATGADAGRAAGARVAGLKGISADLPLTTLNDLLEVTR
ncbi:HAD-IA family hydrolase [Actinomycetospora sp. OC33-EN08]|uniref:HAD-IA family hydrolase n=1 Tax=Actinomycetospora aurantiaca TaxID=3129233 RepID=A0ABU8MKL5_9PSEU